MRLQSALQMLPEFIIKGGIFFPELLRMSVKAKRLQKEMSGYDRTLR
jgi:hypothetical protein